MLTGVYAPSSGSITFDEHGTAVELGGRKPNAICRAGVARTFQNIRLFKELTVLENVVSAMQLQESYGLLATFGHTPVWKRSEADIRQRSREMLGILGLADKESELARNLPYGDQRHLEIARALATAPSLLLLDEPAAGMNPAETAELTTLISWIRENFDLTILLIEHDMSLVMTICERIYVLDHGIVIASGTPDEVQHDPQVIEAYLARRPAMFEIHDLQVNFGGIQALKGISLSVEDGQIVTLIGANGAGKTTTLRTASGLERPSGGTITLAGQDITRASARERVKQGLVQVPEGRRVFPKMSVLENLELGAFLRKDRAGITRDLRDVYERFPVLADRLKQQAGTLSGGEQQMLAMGRALMSRPKMLLLDEPSMGLAPLFVQEIFDIIKRSTKPAPPSCWWSRMQIWPFRSPITHM